MKEDQYLLSSVSNTLDILDLLNDHEELSLAEICKKLHMGKTSAFRMLYTLEAKQFVYKTPDAKYRLGMKFVRFGSNISAVSYTHLDVYKRQHYGLQQSQRRKEMAALERSRGKAVTELGG